MFEKNKKSIKFFSYINNRIRETKKKLFVYLRKEYLIFANYSTIAITYYSIVILIMLY